MNASQQHDIRAFLFDYGGVLTHFDPFPNSEVEIEANRIGMTPIELYRFFWMGMSERSGPMAEWMNGSGSFQSVAYDRQNFLDQRGIRLNARSMIWSSIERPSLPRMLDAVKQLRSSGFTCALTSNQSHEFASHLRNRFELDELFDKVYFSCEIGTQKPRAEYFEHVIDSLGILPCEAVFIDDVKANIDTAQDLGIRGIHLTNHDAAINEIFQIAGMSRSRVTLHEIGDLDV